MPAITDRTVVGVVLPNVFSFSSFLSFVEKSVFDKHDFGCCLVYIAFFTFAYFFGGSRSAPRLWLCHMSNIGLYNGKCKSSRSPSVIGGRSAKVGV
jgi:hypothetical protein